MSTGSAASSGTASGAVVHEASSPAARRSRSERLVRSSVLSEFRLLALALGLDPDALMRRVEIDPRYLDSPELTLPMDQVVELLEIAALASGIDDFGLQLGKARGLPDLGLITLMLREEETVREALRTLISLLHLHSDALLMSLDEGDPPVLAVDIIMCRAIQYRQAMDTSVASITNILRWLLGENWSPESVGFTHARPPSTARFEAFFRCPIDYHQEFNGVVLRQQDLSQVLPRSSPVLRRQVERVIGSINVAPTETYVHRVTQVIAMALPRGEASANNVARVLGTDRRNLNRRLGRAGLNYSQALESVRVSLATQYLLGGERPLCEVADLVGFDSLATFCRWFTGSFGKPPGAWRKQRLAEPTGGPGVPICQTNLPSGKRASSGQE